ncbi:MULTISPECIES: transglutaminase family protein [Methylotenera]|uniref:transglutaminase family protein n=1 Tax=Methylotenera TaxID=359407 RepID=UPI00037A3A7B|nr:MULTISPECIES: transglutaminase family protein [Methylotenera]
MRLTIEHHTQYVYTTPVNYTIQQLRLTPQSGFGQHVKYWDIKVQGQMHEFEDAFGNTTHTLVVDTPHTELSVTVVGEVETGVNDYSQEQPLPLIIFMRDTPLTLADAAIKDFAMAFKHKPIDDLMHGLVDKVGYIPGATEVTTTAIEAFRLGQGVCQDHAHVFIACCRSLGYPARYVSGYLFTQDGSLMQSHAWVDVWFDNVWQSIDVSNGCHAGETYVRLATGLDYRTASPVTGMRSGGGSEGMATSVVVNQAGVPIHQKHKLNQIELLKQAQLIQQAQHAQQ